MLAQTAHSEDESDDDGFASNSGSEKPGLDLDRLDTSPILLPKDYDPVAKLNELEALNSFLAKNNCLQQPLAKGQGEETKTKMKRKHQSLAKELAGRRIVRDMQVIGCILLELFMPKKFLGLGPHASLKAR